MGLRVRDLRFSVLLPKVVLDLHYSNMDRISHSMRLLVL
jgi:hypothetical protein